MSTWMITGCSTGLGRALAEAVISSGHNAVVTARDPSSIADLAESAPARVLAVALDVTKPEQVASAVSEAQARFGGVDVLVNNAGYGYRAAVEQTLTMRPQPRSAIDGAMARIARKGAITLSSYWARQSSSGTSLRSRHWAVPALLTRTSISPK